MDEYLTGFPLLIAGLCLCLGISGVYGLQRFCNDIQHMTKAKVGVWWKVMWISVTPVVIVVSGYNVGTTWVCSCVLHVECVNIHRASLTTLMQCRVLRMDMFR